MADLAADSPLAPARALGRLVIRTQAGLGNRLSALLSSLVIADLLQVALTIVWPSRDQACFGNFTALFEPLNYPDVTFQDETADMVWTDARHFSAAQLRASMARGETLHIAAYTIFGYDLKPGWEFFEACREHLRRIRPVPEIRMLVEQASAAQIGLHVRLSDHFPCHWLTPRWCYRVTLDVLTQRFPHETFFVCADTKEFVDELETRYPGRVIASPARNLASLKVRGTLEGSRAAVTDLWILAHCPIVISTPLSSFAVTAQNLGGGLSYLISKVANPAKFRRTQLAWKTQSFLRRDLDRNRWAISADLQKPLDRAFARIVVVFANLISSSWFQDRPRVSTRRRFEARLKSFLDSSECQKALAAKS